MHPLGMYPCAYGIRSYYVYIIAGHMTHRVYARVYAQKRGVILVVGPYDAPRALARSTGFCAANLQRDLS